MKSMTMPSKYLRICLAFGGLILAAGCVIATPTPTAMPPTEEVVAPPAGEWCKPATVAVPSQVGEAAISAKGSYIEGQIILAGTAQDLNTLAPQFQLTELAQLNPREAQQATPGTETRYGPFEAIAGQWHIAAGLPYASFEQRLYGYDQKTYTSVQDLVNDIYAQQQQSGDVRVFADPNYLVVSPSSQLPIVSGSPWGVEISPWGVEISPSGGESAGQARQRGFWAQWALHETPGTNALTGADPRYDRPKWTGRGDRVDIAVFDTSPYAPGFYWFDTYHRQLYLGLCVSKITPAVTLPPVEKSAPEIKEHGLFVAGLAHAVAPASQVSLIQVLDDGAQGDLATLIYGLNWYMASHAGQGANSAGTLDHTVINLSLGFVPDLGDTFPHASEVVFQNARDLGAVIVAAAGNHSAGITPPLAPELPAAWTEVIGVGASNKKGDRSCYANSSDDVYAPGGDGDLSAPSGCEPSWTACAQDDPACGYGVISLVSHGLTPPDAEYAFWSGSSFSSPLTSGLAALLLEAGVLPADVPSKIGGSAAGPVPVINVEAASP
jgi:hypothetical protein